MNGVIIVDKPASWTSHDVVNRMRRILGQRSIGHLGTLDPLATGLLPIVAGSFTRLAQFYTASEKTYEGVIRFGFATTTYDADGDPIGEISPTPSHRGTADALQRLASEFTGVIQQTPPPFSAKKIHGVPAYKLARQHKEVELNPVQVEIKEFVITSVEGDRAHFRARVSAGTYMRSVAHDLGQRLGCGAHLASLRRTSVAEFDITQARTLEAIETHISPIASWSGGLIRPPKPSSEAPHPDNDVIPSEARSLVVIETRGHASDVPIEREAFSIASLFIHPRQLLPQFPSVTADEPTAARIRNGRPVNLPELSRARHVKVFANQTDLIAIATRVAGSLFHPKIVFPPE